MVTRDEVLEREKVMRKRKIEKRRNKTINTDRGKMRERISEFSVMIFKLPFFTTFLYFKEKDKRARN